MRRPRSRKCSAARPQGRDQLAEVDDGAHDRAAGAIEAGVTALTVSRDVVTPTINYEHGRGLRSDYTPNVAREQKVQVAVSNSFGFGGHNLSLVFSKP